jgi:predicted Zn-dependent peptidase
MFHTMKVRNLVQKIAAGAVVLAAAIGTFAQRSQAPKQEKLLNGMKLLIWNDPSAQNVSVKVRVHSGTAFDPQGKEGVMALLAESFFPNEGTREFYRDDLGGDLNVTTNYDYIQIDASSKPDQFLTMLESVANAVATPTIDKETTPKLVARRLEKIKELEKDPAYIANLAAVKQLFGTFPYGRPELGTADSAAKINFADLLEAKQRFLGADNATVVISGNVDPALAFRAARRYFGAWLKSDKLVPPTFKQPDAPDTKLVTISSDPGNATTVRFAFRGVARNDRLYPASEILASILETRLKDNLSGLNASNAYVSNEAHVLPGTVVLGFDMAGNEPASGNTITALLARPVTAAEFAAAKAAVSDTRKKIAAEEFWLDADTYKQPSAAAEQKGFDSVTVAEVQLLAESFAKNPVVAVALTRSDKTASN